MSSSIQAKNNTQKNSVVFREVEEEDNDDKNPLIIYLGNYKWVKLLNNSSFILKKGNNNIYEFKEIIYRDNHEDIKIDYIKNTLTKDFILDFNPQSAKRNIRLGYNDTMKYFMYFSLTGNGDYIASLYQEAGYTPVFSIL